MLMYYSALCHMAAALILIVIWRKKLGYQKVKSLLEILLISGAGVVIQLLYHPLLTTGNSGTIYYDQQSSCKYRYTYRII